MAGFLSTGVSGLLAFQRALDVTSHNIANVGTDGYSRQRAEFMTRPAHPYGNGWVGSGVVVTTTKRLYDDVVAQQVRTASSSLGRFEAFGDQIERVNNLFSNTTTGLTATLQRFANALQDVANAPASSSARQVLLSEARGVAERFKSYDSQLVTLDNQVATQINAEVADISQIASSLADLNRQISDSFASSGQPPNDLLDQRDRLLDDLSSRIEVATVRQEDGSVNVFVGSGQPLVLGSEAARLTTVADPYDASRKGIALQLAGGSAVEITSNLSGGSLGGLLDFRTQVLDPTRNALGRMSIAFADVINDQHHAGIDLNGALGQDLFGIGGVSTLAHRSNTGTATFAVTRTDTGALTEADYQLQFSAGTWTARRLDTGATVTLTGTGTVGDPLRADGLAIVVSGTPLAGDRFVVRPTRSAAAGMDVLISDPGRLAAAAPIRTATNAANTGNGLISAGSVTDATNPALRNTVTIQFLSATTYSVNGAGTFAYTSGAPININGWSAQISGAPAVGDTFTISDNSSGAGDNRNALALVDALRRPVLDGGTTSIDAASSSLVGSIGVATRQVQASRDAQAIVQQEAVDSRDSISGVNLDEEAANLLRYQQAYQAAAQLIRVASTMFDSLLAATNRG
jgi:flagellar hook-associated protein 1 FlgK